MCEGAGHDASIGRALPHDEVELLRFFRSGHRDGRVWSWVDYVDNGLVIENRTGYEQGCGFFFFAGWTCHYSLDGALVQLGFVVSSSCMTIWYGIDVIRWSAPSM